MFSRLSLTKREKQTNRLLLTWKLKKDDKMLGKKFHLVLVLVLHVR